MNNLLAARFANSPVIVSRDKSDWLGSCLENASRDMAEVTERLATESAAMYDDFWPHEDSWLANRRPYIIQNGTLLIPVKGALLHDYGYQSYDWATGYIYIQKAFERGMADGSVQRIAMVIESYGGEVAGCFDALDRVFAMRGQKPIVALVNEHAYSAAFAWASVADKIVITRTGGVGSVGVITSHTDWSECDKRIGMKVTLVYAGEHKADGNAYEPLPESVKNRMQARVNGLYDIFVSTVARNLALDEQVVRGTEALTYSADEAVELGFAHEVRAFDEALAAFSSGLSITVGEENMSEQTPEAIQAGLDAARAEGQKEGALAERARILGITGSEEAKSRPALAFHLSMNTDQTVESAKGILAASAEEAVKVEQPPKAEGNAFADAMANGNPNLSADGGDESLDAGQQLIRDYKAATGN